MKKKKASKEQRYQKLQKVIQIKLSHRQDRNVNPQGFVKIIEQEYASKYLEMLNIEPSNANIKMLLKNYPLNKCDIIPYWNENDASNPDYIQIVPLKKREKQTQPLPKAPPSDQKITIQDVEDTTYRPLKLPDENEIKRFDLSFAVEDIKSKYIFPFNNTKQKRDNIYLQNKHISSFSQRDDIYYLPKLQGDPGLIYEQPIFQFPFSHASLNQQIIEIIQTPPKIQFESVLEYLKGFAKEFPKTMIPLEDRSRTALRLTERDYTELMKILQQDIMAQMIGLFCHLSYHIVLGDVNPVQVEPLIKKQIFVNLMEKVQALKQSHHFTDKTWKFLCYPMIILTLKMQTENVYKNQYFEFFQNQRDGDLLMDKIFHLLDNIFDPSGLEGRFIFLEKDQRYLSKPVAEKKNHLQKRLYSVSPQIEMLLPNPQESRARLLLLKNRQYFNKQTPAKEQPKQLQHNFQEIMKLTKKMDQQHYQSINYSYNQKNYQILKNKLQIEK